MRLTSFAVAVLLPALVGASCTSPRRTEATGDRAGYFVRHDGPDPLACKIDGDCRPGPGVNPDNGCCDTGVSQTVFSQAYLEWRAHWVKQSCQRVTCPPQPPPAPPLPCALQGRCVNGRCNSRCEPPHTLP